MWRYHIFTCEDIVSFLSICCHSLYHWLLYNKMICTTSVKNTHHFLLTYFRFSWLDFLLKATMQWNHMITSRLWCCRLCFFFSFYNPHPPPSLNTRTRTRRTLTSKFLIYLKLSKVKSNIIFYILSYHPLEKNIAIMTANQYYFERNLLSVANFHRKLFKVRVLVR